MAKQIKVIKCPNCGSVQKTEIKPDHYRCDNCQTEYFLDNDDINIHIKRSSSSVINDITRNKTLMIIAGIVLFFILLALASIIDKNTRTEKLPIIQIRTSAEPNTVHSINAKTGEIKSEERKLLGYAYCDIKINDKPYIFTIEEYQYGNQPHSYYFMIYNLLNGKLLKPSKIHEIKSNKYGLIKFNYLDFSQDKTYFVANDNTVYLLDKINYKFTNITSSLLDNHPDYQTGLASITISKTTSGNAFHILTNDGKKIYYYPLIDEVYVDDHDFQMIKNRPKRPPDDTSEHLAFSFADYYGQDNKLIKYTFVSPDGKNHIEPRSTKVGSYKQDGSSDRHTDENSAYDLLNNSNLDVKIISHQNLTPGRLYFDPSILYFDNNTLIIKTKVNAAPDANYNYQQIDISNGKVIWTLSDEEFTIKKIITYGDNFIAKQDCSRYAIISTTGNIIKRVILHDEK